MLSLSERISDLQKQVDLKEADYQQEVKRANVMAQNLIQIRDKISIEINQTHFSLLDHEEQLAKLEFDEA